VSALTKIPISREVALTGEITLGGDILAIGGLNEKIVAAKRAGFRVVLVPRENEKDLKELPKGAREGLEIRLVENMDQVLAAALKAPRKSFRVGDESLEAGKPDAGPPVTH